MLNPDKKIVSIIKEKLKETNGYCPCVPNSFWDENTKCPCKEYREIGNCRCGLYIKKEGE